MYILTLLIFLGGLIFVTTIIFSITSTEQLNWYIASPTHTGSTHFLLARLGRVGNLESAKAFRIFWINSAGNSQFRIAFGVAIT